MLFFVAHNFITNVVVDLHLLKTRLVFLIISINLKMDFIYIK